MKINNPIKYWNTKQDKEKNIERKKHLTQRRHSNLIVRRKKEKERKKERKKKRGIKARKTVAGKMMDDVGLTMGLWSILTMSTTRYVYRVYSVQYYTI